MSNKLDTRPPFLKLHQMVNGNPQETVFRCDRKLLSGVLMQHAKLLEVHENLFKEYQALQMVHKKTVYGPVFINNMMKLVGGGFA